MWTNERQKYIIAPLNWASLPFFLYTACMPFFKPRSVNEWRAITLAHTRTCQCLFRCAIVAYAKVYMNS